MARPMQTVGGAQAQPAPSKTNPKVRVRGAPGLIMMDGPEVEKIPWTGSEFFPGLYFKYLYVDLEKGADIGLMKLDRGAQLQVHQHLSTAALFCIKGRFSYQPAGSIGPGGFGFEPYGIIHEPDTATEEETIVLTVNTASSLIRFYDKSGNPSGYNHQLLMLREAYRQHGERAVAHLNLPPHIWED